MSQTSTNLAADSWAIADLLRGDFKQSQYGRIILPFCLLRRLECVLEASKSEALQAHEKTQQMNLPEEGAAQLIRHTLGGIAFFNISKMDLGKLGEADIKANLEGYIQGFSKDARDIFEYFNFNEFIAQLNDANLLYKVVQKVRTIDLSPSAVSNHDMGLVFEELIRRFAESSNETAGEHFTPRDIVRLTTSLVLMEAGDKLSKPDAIHTIYDPTAGTGGFLSAGMEFMLEQNPSAVMRAFGQELNPESYAICKADMLIKGQEVGNIKLGNTLSNDQLYNMRFDYMLSNPPFGVDWKKIEREINEEHALKGFGGRFGPGLPRVSDGSLLFLLHLIGKMRSIAQGGARIGIILNGSPLFTGGAGSGESEIRRHVLEHDLLEAIIALPTDMFYNTGISTYVWLLSNKKSKARQGLVQLINGVNLCGKMRKSLGSKRNEMSPDDIATITRCYGEFEAMAAHDLGKPAEVKSSRGRQSSSVKTQSPKTFAAKLFRTHEFGYRRITIERPLRMSYQFSDARIAGLRFEAGALNALMSWVYGEFSAVSGAIWSDHADCPHYGQLSLHQDAIRRYVKTHFPDLKEKQLKALLDRQCWLDQKTLLTHARALQAVIGSAQFDDMNSFDVQLSKACKSCGISLAAPHIKALEAAIAWKNPEAMPIIKKIHKAKPNPIYGLFEAAGKTLEYKSDGELRDFENVALDPSRKVNAINEAYFLKEVAPHVPDAWIDSSKCDAIDKQIGIVGYEIAFNRHFYQYQPPRALADIDADLDAVSAEIMQLLREVHS